MAPALIVPPTFRLPPTTSFVVTFRLAVVVLWVTFRLPKEPLLRTISCYSEDPAVGNYCGRCPSCFRKWVAFVDNGLSIEFHDEEIKKRYREAALQGKYVEKRCRSILRALGG